MGVYFNLLTIPCSGFEQFLILLPDFLMDLRKGSTFGGLDHERVDTLEHYGEAAQGDTILHSPDETLAIREAQNLDSRP